MFADGDGGAGAEVAGAGKAAGHDASGQPECAVIGGGQRLGSGPSDRQGQRGDDVDLPAAAALVERGDGHRGVAPAGRRVAQAPGDDGRAALEPEVIVDDWPEFIEVGFALRLTVGAGVTAFIVTVLVIGPVVPSGPEHSSV